MRFSTDQDAHATRASFFHHGVDAAHLVPLCRNDVYGIFRIHPAGLDFASAIVVLAVASVGVAIPTPGGTGSYHVLTLQALTKLFGVDAPTALSYATLTHALSFILVSIIGGYYLWRYQWRSRMRSNFRGRTNEQECGGARPGGVDVPRMLRRGAGARVVFDASAFPENYDRRSDGGVVHFRA